MPWLVPEYQLDTQQRQFLDNVDIDAKNVWIKGFAGSGKSVLLVYTIKKIRSRSRNASVLLIVFTRSLVELFSAAFNELGFNVKVDTYYGFLSSFAQYDYILCDEVQDLTPRVIEAMTARGRHVIVAGDSNQSIYERDPKWREETVSPSQIGSLINGDEFELNIIHRLTRSIISAINHFLPRMRIFEARRDMTRQDVQIRLCEAPSLQREVSYVMDTATRAVNRQYTAAILIPTQTKIIDFAQRALADKGKPQWNVELNQYGKTNYGSLNRHLAANGLKMQYVGSGYGSFSDDANKITLMTFHSAKGLDFDQVFIPFANTSMSIHANETLAKILFMVAMTRARRELYITYYGYPSDYLDSFEDECSHIDIDNLNNNNNQQPYNGNVWGI